MAGTESGDCRPLQQSFIPYSEDMADRFLEPPLDFWQTYPESQQRFLPNIDPFSSRCVICGSAEGCACTQYQDPNIPLQLGYPSMSDNGIENEFNGIENEFNGIENEWNPNLLNPTQQQLIPPQPQRFDQDWEAYYDTCWDYEISSRQLDSTFRPLEPSSPNQAETTWQVVMPVAAEIPTSIKSHQIQTSAKQLEMQCQAKEPPQESNSKMESNSSGQTDNQFIHYARQSKNAHTGQRSDASICTSQHEIVNSNKEKLLNSTKQQEIRPNEIKQLEVLHLNQSDSSESGRQQKLENSGRRTSKSNRRFSSISLGNSARQEIKIPVKQTETSLSPKLSPKTISESLREISQQQEIFTSATQSKEKTLATRIEILASARTPEEMNSTKEPEMQTSARDDKEVDSATEAKLTISKTTLEIGLQNSSLGKQTELANAIRPQMPRVCNYLEKSRKNLGKQSSSVHLEKTGTSLCSARFADKPNTPGNFEKPKCLDKSGSPKHLEKPGSPRHPEKPKNSSEFSSDKALFVGPYEGEQLQVQQLQVQQLQEKVQQLMDQQKLQVQQLFSFGDSIVENSSSEVQEEKKENKSFPPALRKLLKDPRYSSLTEGLKSEDSIPPFPLPLSSLIAYPLLVPYDQFPENQIPQFYPYNPPNNCNSPRGCYPTHLSPTHLSQPSVPPNSVLGQFQETQQYPINEVDVSESSMWLDPQEGQGSPSFSEVGAPNNRIDASQLNLWLDEPLYTGTKKNLTAGGQGGQGCPNICEGGDPANELYKSHNKKRMADKSPEGCLDVVDTELREAFLHIPLCPLVPDFEKTDVPTCPCPPPCPCPCPSPCSPPCPCPPKCGGVRTCSTRGGEDQPPSSQYGSQPQPPSIPPMPSMPEVPTSQYNPCSRPPTPYASNVFPLSIEENVPLRTVPEIYEQRYSSEDEEMNESFANLKLDDSHRTTSPNIHERRYSNVEDTELYEHIKNLKQIYERAKRILNNVTSVHVPSTTDCPRGGPPNDSIPYSGDYENACPEVDWAPNSYNPSSGDYGNTYTEGGCPPKCDSASSTTNIHYPKMICATENQDDGVPMTQMNSLNSYVNKLVDAVTDDLNNQIRSTVLQGVMDFIHNNHKDL